ncbi:hypothetical protein IFM89_003128 [Coptis chinensis]|uniref:Phytocyanin domain-containing protein n=1 Tax=Coptis chinensis TaxID=261450 RepID=A0A835LY70_9MAGN|nr:hypothetical protein IFM89_003128 [Coptis chinensis]
MASTSSLLFSLVLIFIFFGFSQANDILVGGKTDSWKIPSSQSESLNKWAEKARFMIGDALVLKFDPEKDSVLQVSRKHYVSCSTKNPIVVYKNATTMIVLDKSGPFYFISGAEGHCEQGQKMIVVVLSEVHTFRQFRGISPARAPSPSPSPSPSPIGFEGPAVAPTSGVSGLRSSLLFVMLGSLLLRVVL